MNPALQLSQLFDRPVIILAAPRSGSTLLFETLAEAPQLWTVGGESHQFIEGLRPLNPMAGAVDSNRLDEQQAEDRIVKLLRQRFARMLQDRNGRKFSLAEAQGSVRFLEKTPKNALRQPFLEKVFPGALYIWLLRDPRPNISSMMEAWKAGRWVTYPRLPGWSGPPWSLLLPPGWQEMNGRSLAEICAFQWEAANRIIMDDLGRLPPERWMAVGYDDVTDRTTQTIQRICHFAGLEMDEHLRRHVDGPLPYSRYTQTAPQKEKWRRNENLIQPVLEGIEATWSRCRKIIEPGNRSR